MYANEIEDLMKGTREFMGVFSANNFPTRPNGGGAMIVNTEPHWLSGQHWFALILHPTAGKLTVFDSYASPVNVILPLHEKRLGELMKNCGLYWIEQSPYAVQAPPQQPVDLLNAEGECGEFCIFVIRHMQRYANNLGQLIRHEFIPTDQIFNAKKVQNYVDRL